MKLIELTKICTDCQKRKSINNFYKSKRGKFGTYAKCKQCEKVYDKAYYTSNMEIIKEKVNNHRKNHPANKLKIKGKKVYDKIYRVTNRNKINACRRFYQNNRHGIDYKFRLNKNISGAISMSLKDSKKGAHWEDIVGYTLERLKKHLEKKFTEGMTWENYGKKGWWVDHKIPIATFNYTDTAHEDFKRCWALRNLQPMWAKENILKNAKLSKPFQPSLLL